MNTIEAPVVLLIGGNDPGGGAGLCADIQTMTSLGCHAAPVVTAVTVQTTCGVNEYTPVEADMVRKQVENVFQELDVKAIKTGMLATPAIVSAVSDVLRQHSDLPLVIDPVLASNMGDQLSEHSLVENLLQFLIPLASILTPNIPEYQALASVAAVDPAADAAELARALQTDILLTGAHEPSGEHVVNRLLRKERDLEASEWRWPRLPGEFHGSGCTLASALAAGLANGLDAVYAVERAQAFTWGALKHSVVSGSCQQIPYRLCPRDDR